MTSTLDELRLTKKILAGLVFVVVGVVLINVGEHIAPMPGWEWLQWLRLGELGTICIGAGLLSVWLDHYLKKTNDEADDLRLDRLFTRKLPEMRDMVLAAFAFKPDDLRRVATPDMLDQIITNSLSLRLGDDTFASEIYRDIRDQAVKATERWHDASVSIHLSPAIAGSSTTGAATDPLYVVTVRWEYTTVPAHHTRRFACVGTRDDYDELSHEPGETSAWFFTPKAGLTAGDTEAFEVLQFTVDGTPHKIRRSTRRGGQIYSVNLGSETIDRAEPVTIAYTYRTVVRRDGHLLHFDIEQPTRGISVEFDYGDTDIDRVSVLDLIPTTQAARTERTPKEVPARIIRVDYAGWMFPRSGFAFVWTTPASGHESRIPESTSGTR
ncbi:hypothetical protein HWD35_05815 [Tsukamurella tyrosinosolvens]|uniref:hypothetical protein n=1 Tax=Tsukamurella tyrosinosolvens TaxID=57704 RepID=UPI001CE216FF|nr:hypothetical protein [Tsukamurella tyrosinosolvens]MCA4994223.1 hypothetical protein [Tsukamurella tyrosinosolvens]